MGLCLKDWTVSTSLQPSDHTSYSFLQTSPLVPIPCFLVSSISLSFVFACLFTSLTSFLAPLYFFSGYILVAVSRVTLSDKSTSLHYYLLHVASRP